MATWKQQILKEVMDYCDQNGSRTFTLPEFLDERLAFLQSFRPENKNVAAKVRQQLQVLRDENLLTFVNGRGSYTLRTDNLLAHEKEALADINLWDLNEDKTPEIAGRIPTPKPRMGVPETREYFIETYVRDAGWAKTAKDTLGTDCLINDCGNTFNKPDGTPYIEVHHIVPLCEGGEEGVWNLSVLCAHHHRMAHFADTASKKDMRRYLLGYVGSKVKEAGL